MQCLVEGCENEAWSRGYCSKHHAKLRRSGELKNLPKKSGGVCLAEGCDRVVTKHGGFGYCTKHYQRYKKHGDPHRADWKELKGNNLEEKLRFNSIENENGCWIWQGGKTNFGYGTIGIGNNKTELVHRLAYKFWDGEVSSDLFVCHHCDQPLCVNPNHLFLGTNQDNIDDKMYKGRAYTGVHKGELNVRSSLTDKQVKELKYDLFKRNMKQVDLCEKFGVSRDVVSSIFRGRTWTHIECPEKAPRKVKRRKRKI